ERALCGAWALFFAISASLAAGTRPGRLEIGGKKCCKQESPTGRTEIGIDKKHHMNMDHAAWEGFDIDGHVDTVLSRGKVVIDNDEYLGSKGHGQYLKRGMNQYLV
ncbi:MAG: hypothetical protein VW929_03565, partial [Actinomycetota bacterium]